MADRVEQGLPPQIVDPAVLARVVALIHAQQGREEAADSGAIEEARSIMAFPHRSARDSAPDGDPSATERCEAGRSFQREGRIDDSLLHISPGLLEPM